MVAASTLPHLSPHLSLPPRIFICDYHDTKIALSFYLALTSSPDCVSGLWSESVSPPPATTVVPDVDTVDVNQPSDLDPKVSAQSSPTFTSFGAKFPNVSFKLVLLWFTCDAVY